MTLAQRIVQTIKDEFMKALNLPDLEGYVIQYDYANDGTAFDYKVNDLISTFRIYKGSGWDDINGKDPLASIDIRVENEGMGPVLIEVWFPASVIVNSSTYNISERIDYTPYDILRFVTLLYMQTDVLKNYDVLLDDIDFNREVTQAEVNYFSSEEVL